MMKMKRAVMMAVLALALAALSVPVIGLRARASADSRPASRLASSARSVATSATPASSLSSQQEALDPSPQGRISAETLKALGLSRLPKGVSAVEASRR